MAYKSRFTLLQILLTQVLFATFALMNIHLLPNGIPFSCNFVSIGQGIVAGIVSSVSLLMLPDRWTGFFGQHLQRVVRETQWRIIGPLGPMGWVIISVAAGMGEELFFRGFVQTSLGERFGLLTGILVASAFFGLVHFAHWSLIVMTGLLGIYFGLLYHSTGNILVPILAHSVHNTISLFGAAKLFGYPLPSDPAVPMENGAGEAVSSRVDDITSMVDEKRSDST